MYKSPIEIIYGQMETQMEGNILRAVQKCDVNVDKEELIRALQYDRGQYWKGYRDAMEKQKWIPVTERLPEKDGWYLCYIRSSAFRGAAYLTILPYDQQGFRTGYVYTDDVTHWMPLPEPPED